MFSWGIYGVILTLILGVVVSRTIPYDKKISKPVKLKYSGQIFLQSPVRGTIKQIQVGNSEFVKQNQVIADITGENQQVISVQSPEPGKYIYAGKPIASGDWTNIGDTLGYIIPTLKSGETIYGELLLNPEDISKISIGNPVNIFIGQRQVGLPIQGNVSYISAIPYRLGGFSVLVKFDETEFRSLLKEGMYIPALTATAEIVFERSSIFNEITERIRKK